MQQRREPRLVLQPFVCIPFTLGLVLLLSAGLLRPSSSTVPRHVIATTTPPHTGGVPVLTREALRAAAATYVPEMFDNTSADAAPAHFLDGFRNPCWRAPSDGTLRCVPLVHVLGAYQCGASDLFSRLSAHELFVPPLHGSPSFYFEQNHKWPEYVRVFSKAAARIAEAPAERITGEGSAGMLTLTWTHSERLHQPYISSMGRRWQACNANRSRAPGGDALFNACMQAYMPTAHALDRALAARAGAPLEVPHLLRAVQGERARLLALVRNPADRLYVAFWHYPHYKKRFGASADGFHAYHTEMAGHFAACVGAHGVDACALRFESLERRFEQVFYHCDQHAKGLYAPFFRVWLGVFGRELLLVLRTEDYTTRTREALRRVFAHVGLPEPASEAGWARILDKPIALNGRNRVRNWTEIPRMKDETRALVDDFYRESNAQLAGLLGDDAFTWADRVLPRHGGPRGVVAPTAAGL